jgi:hypothetical protein
MKIYVVYRGFPLQVFLDEDIAKKYIESVDTSPYEIGKYRIKEMETADELFKNFKIVTSYWFRYELKDGKNHNFFLNTREENSLDNNLSNLIGALRYEETLYHNSVKPRVRSIIGSFYVGKRESDIENDMYREKFRGMCKELIEDIIHFRTTEHWSVEQVNQWLPKEAFVIK